MAFILYEKITENMQIFSSEN